MKILNRNQERIILNYLRANADFIANGSSRMVFDLPAEVLQECGLPLLNREWVAKVPVGVGGMNQMNLEVNTFMDYEYDLPLAEILAAGRFVEIMEKVDTHDYLELAGEICYDDTDEDLEDVIENEYYYLDDSEDDRDLRGRLTLAAQAIRSLASVFGRTSDNGQIGLNADNEFVAYDYGFEVDGGCATYCTDYRILDIALDETENYFDQLLGILDDEEATLESLEEVIRAQNGINDDNEDDDDENCEPQLCSCSSSEEE